MIDPRELGLTILDDPDVERRNKRIRALVKHPRPPSAKGPPGAHPEAIAIQEALPPERQEDWARALCDAMGGPKE